MRFRTTLFLLVSVGLTACSANSKPSVKPATNIEPKQESKDHVVTMDAAQVFGANCREMLVAAKAVLPKVTRVTGTRTIDNTLLPYNELLRLLANAGNFAGLNRSIHPDAKIRDEARKCEQEIQSFASGLKLNKQVYTALISLDTTKFDANAKRFVAHELRDYRRSGVDKDDATRNRLKRIEEELVKLKQEFAKNVVQDVRYIEVRERDLAGLPADYVKRHTAGPRGLIKITTNYPDYFPFNAYATSTKLRRELYVKYRARGDKSNAPILVRVIKLRQEKAQILGYKHFADYATETRMMKTGKRAADFIARMVRVSAKRARKDYAEMLAFKRLSEPNATRIEDYEKVYFSNKVKAKSYAFDVRSVRPYLPYKRVEKGLLAITAKMYDIQYAKVDVKVWHTSVNVYDVMRGNKKLGRIYLDMHPRDGKYKHAAQFDLKTGVRNRQLPEGVLVCNFPDPSKGPALMEHTQVETMFHEFGHLMHHVLAGDKQWISQSGVATEFDFVEAPSQMFEEWAWSYDTIKTFAKHYETGEVIPEALVKNMVRARTFGVGLFVRQQMFYASVSLNFYMKDPSKLDLAAEVKRLQAKLTPFRYVQGTSFHLNFGHLMGYSANYYTYMWSLVIAKDLLTPFKRYGLLDREWTTKYRDKILVPGGTRDAAVLVKDFLGREFNFKAFEAFINS